MKSREEWNTFKKCAIQHPEIIELPEYKPKGADNE
jgi:hypothetical protein